MFNFTNPTANSAILKTDAGVSYVVNWDAIGGTFDFDASVMVMGKFHLLPVRHSGHTRIAAKDSIGTRVLDVHDYTPDGVLSLF